MAIGERLGRNIMKVRFSHNCAMNQWGETSQHSCDQSKLKQENLSGPQKNLATHVTIALTFRDPYQYVVKRENILNEYNQSRAKPGSSPENPFLKAVGSSKPSNVRTSNK